MTNSFNRVAARIIVLCVIGITLGYWVLCKNTFTEPGRVRALVQQLTFVCNWVGIFQKEYGRLPVVAGGDAVASNRSFVRILSGRDLEQNPNGYRFEYFQPDIKKFGVVYLGGFNKEKDLWLDPWGGAYWIRNLNDGLEIRSAGPDRLFFTSDDVVSVEQKQ